VDQFAERQMVRSLTIIEVSRERVPGEADQRLKGDDVVRPSNRSNQERGLPKLLFYDNGSEFTSQTVAYQNRVKIEFVCRGNPTTTRSPGPVV
jgi:putative transposase